MPRESRSKMQGRLFKASVSIGAEGGSREEAAEEVATAARMASAA